jgi:hypothetical protein
VDECKPLFGGDADGGGDNGADWRLPSLPHQRSKLSTQGAAEVLTITDGNGDVAAVGVENGAEEPDDADIGSRRRYSVSDDNMPRVRRSARAEMEMKLAAGPESIPSHGRTPYHRHSNTTFSVQDFPSSGLSELSLSPIMSLSL